MSASVRKAASIDVGFALYESSMTVAPRVVRRTCIRRSDTSAALRAPANVERDRPRACPTANAAAALEAMWRPGMARATLARSPPITTSNRARPSSSTVSPSIRTSASTDSPYRITGADERDAIARTRSSSAFKMAKPCGGNASMSSPLARATPSSPPTSSVCASPTLVTTPIDGRAMRQRSAICPNPRIPISSTSARVSAGALTMVTGRPCSLLKLRTFAVVVMTLLRATAMRSLVDVLPTEPVTPITTVDAGKSVRTQPPASINASAVSRTRTAVAPKRSWESSREVRYATAPAASASPM